MDLFNKRCINTCGFIVCVVFLIKFTYNGMKLARAQRRPIGGWEVKDFLGSYAMLVKKNDILDKKTDMLDKETDLD